MDQKVCGVWSSQWLHAAPHSTWVGVRGQLIGVGSVLPPWGSQRVNSGCQAEHSEPLPPEHLSGPGEELVAVSLAKVADQAAAPSPRASPLVADYLTQGIVKQSSLLWNETRWPPTSGVKVRGHVGRVRLLAEFGFSGTCSPFAKRNCLAELLHGVRVCSKYQDYSFPTLAVIFYDNFFLSQPWCCVSAEVLGHVHSRTELNNWIRFSCL